MDQMANFAGSPWEEGLSVHLVWKPPKALPCTDTAGGILLVCLGKRSCWIAPQVFMGAYRKFPETWFLTSEAWWRGLPWRGSWHWFRLDLGLSSSCLIGTVLWLCRSPLNLWLMCQQALSLTCWSSQRVYFQGFISSSPAIRPPQKLSPPKLPLPEILPVTRSCPRFWVTSLSCWLLFPVLIPYSYFLTRMLLKVPFSSCLSSLPPPTGM